MLRRGVARGSGLGEYDALKIAPHGKSMDCYRDAKDAFVADALRGAPTGVDEPR